MCRQQAPPPVTLCLFINLLIFRTVEDGSFPVISGICHWRVLRMVLFWNLGPRLLKKIQKS